MTWIVSAKERKEKERRRNKNAAESFYVTKLFLGVLCDALWVSLRANNRFVR